ncbi:MAG: lipid II flippase MurJ, partial [bacterium]|nr:lipid II flippase MurJ [bacterium]
TYVKQVLFQMGPASLGIALAQINICMDGWLAFYGAEWAPAVLEYADRIIYLPLGLFGTAFATVLLPIYAKQYAAGNLNEVLATFESALKNIFIIMAPMALGLCVLAAPTVSLIYERGAFNQASVLWTARAVAAYAPGLLAFSAAKTVIPIFYAQKDVKTPVKVASWCILGNFTLNLLSVIFLPEGWRHVGIALSTVLNSMVNTWILLYILRRRGIKPNLFGLCATLFKTLFAAGVMAIAVVYLFAWLNEWMPMGFAYLGVVCVAPFVYFPLILLIAHQEFLAFLQEFPLLKRLKRRR